MTSDLQSLVLPHGLLDATLAPKLRARIDAAPLFAHAYAFHLNFRLGAMSPGDLLDFAHGQQLAGVNIHVADGEARSLLAIGAAERSAFGRRAAKLGLKVHVETSSTRRRDLAEAIEIARQVDAETVRCYPRHAGRLSMVMRQVIDDLQALPELDPDGRFRFLLEQHEDLKSTELVRIVETVGNPRLSLLFDFGNMVNAYERPEEALAVMAPHVSEVHIKDIEIVPDRGGWGHLACKSGTGSLHFPTLLFRLLMLGEAQPQVRAFALEEEVDYFAPAFRFPDEGPDPLIPHRPPSETAVPEGAALAERLAREYRDAVEQIAFVRDIMRRMRSQAEALCLSGGHNALARKTT